MELLALHNPSVYVEVGSGNSTKFARRAVQDHGLRTRIVSIDPYPRREVDAICDEVIRHPCEDMDMTFFADLPGDAMLFVDNSHRSFQNSDVTVFFMEILPVLRHGHDLGPARHLLPLRLSGSLERPLLQRAVSADELPDGRWRRGRNPLPNGLISTSQTLMPAALKIFEGPHFDGTEKLAAASGCSEVVAKAA